MDRTPVSRLGQALHGNVGARLGEILLVFLVPGLLIAGIGPLVGDDPIESQLVVWVANILMIGLVYGGLRLRGQGWRHLGVLSPGEGRGILPTLGLSVLVFVAAIGAFVIGAIVGANLVGVPEAADVSGYDFMRGNLPMLLVSLVGAYIAASFGEEVVYRGFLITRIAELGSGRKGAWRWGVLVSSVVFGLAHYAWGPMGIIQTTFMGLALAIAYLRVGRNLWVTILAHAYMDTILFVQMYLGASPAG